jgi:hypothetical protein
MDPPAPSWSSFESPPIIDPSAPPAGSANTTVDATTAIHTTQNPTDQIPPKNTEAAPPPKTIAVIPSLVVPSDTPSNTTADATTAIHSTQKPADEIPPKTTPVIPPPMEPSAAPSKNTTDEVPSKNTAVAPPPKNTAVVPSDAMPSENPSNTTVDATTAVHTTAHEIPTLTPPASETSAVKETSTKDAGPEPTTVAGQPSKGPPAEKPSSVGSIIDPITDMLPNPSASDSGNNTTRVQPTDLVPTGLKPTDLIPSGLKPTDLNPTAPKPTDLIPTKPIPSNIIPTSESGVNTVTDVLPSKGPSAQNPSATGSGLNAITDMLPAPSPSDPETNATRPEPTDLIPTDLVPSGLNPSNLIPTTLLPSDLLPTTKTPVLPIPTDAISKGNPSSIVIPTSELPLGPLPSPINQLTNVLNGTSVVNGVTSVIGGATSLVGGVTSVIGGATSVVGGATSVIGGVTSIIGSVTSAIDSALPTLVTTNSQGMPVVVTSGLLPTVTGPLLPSMATTNSAGLPLVGTGGILPTIVLPTIPGVIPSVTPGVIPSITPGVLPSVTPGVLPSVIPGVIPSITPGVIPGITPGVPLNGTVGIPASETLLTPVLPTLNPSEILSLTNGVSLPGASGTGGLPTLVDASKLVPTNTLEPNLLPSQALANGTLVVPTPSDGSAVTGVSPTTDASKTGTGIPTTEDGPMTTLQPSPGSSAGGNASSITTTAEHGIAPTDVAGLPTGANTTGVSVKETPINPVAAIPTSEKNVATEPDKVDQPPVQQSSVVPAPAVQPTSAIPQPSASVQPSGGSTPTTTEDANPATHDATFGTYMSTPTGYVPETSTEPLVAFPTGPSIGKDGETPPPPLSKPQTIGIALGGTCTMLMALVAALFIARRYHQNAAAKRNSAGSVYPEVAYLYDPPVGGNGDAEAGGGMQARSGGAGGDMYTMSGGAGGGMQQVSGGNGGLSAAAAVARASPRPHTVDYSTLPQNSPGHQTPMNFGAIDMIQNPFRDPTPSGSAQRSPNVASQQTPFADPIVTKATPKTEYAATPPTDFAELSALHIKPFAYNPAAADYPPLSPYGSGPPSEIDPFADPFEHDNTDLLLNVDVGQETEDSIVVVATPHTPHSPFAERRVMSPTVGGHYEPPAPCASHFPGRDSRCNSLIPGEHSPQRRYMPDRHMSMSFPRPPATPLGIMNPSLSSSTPSLLMGPPAKNNSSNTVASAVPSSRTTVTPEPIAAPPRAASPPPVSRGWSDIMKEPEAIPAPLSIQTATTRKPVPVRLASSRPSPALSGPGQHLVATPLIIKKKPVAGANLAVPPSSYHMPSKTDTMSDDLMVQRKRSGELLFADPRHIGRPL